MSSCIITGMSIQELHVKFKGIYTNPEILLAALIVIVALVSFALGRTSISDTASIVEQNTTQEQQPTVIGQEIENTVQKPSEITNAATVVQEKTGYVASKNGTKYHLPWCGSARQIKEENKIWFETKEDAEKAGYTPASNCKGI